MEHKIAKLMLKDLERTKTERPGVFGLRGKKGLEFVGFFWGVKTKVSFPGVGNLWEIFGQFWGRSNL